MRKLLGICIGIALLISIPIFWIFKHESRPRPDPPSILAQVQRLNQLTTVKYTIQKVVGLTEQKQPVGSESILLIVQATVQAGIDLASMRREDITVRRDGTVIVRLPPAKILNVFIDENETKVWDRHKTWWTPWVGYSLDLEQRARLAGVQAASQAALGMGILPQAQLNAETSIRGLLGLAGVKAVQFSIATERAGLDRSNTFLPATPLSPCATHDTNNRIAVFLLLILKNKTLTLAGSGGRAALT